MKKIIGTIGVVAIAMTMFLNTNSVNGSSDLDLASLISLNTASAEHGGGGPDCSPGETKNAVVYDADRTKCEYYNNRCCCPDDF